MRVGRKDACRNGCLCRGRSSCAVGVSGVPILECITVEICMTVINRLNRVSIQYNRVVVCAINCMLPQELVHRGLVHRKFCYRKLLVTPTVHGVVAFCAMHCVREPAQDSSDLAPDAAVTRVTHSGNTTHAGLGSTETATPCCPSRTASAWRSWQQAATRGEWQASMCTEHT